MPPDQQRRTKSAPASRSVGRFPLRTIPAATSCAVSLSPTFDLPACMLPASLWFSRPSRIRRQRLLRPDHRGRPPHQSATPCRASRQRPAAHHTGCSYFRAAATSSHQRRALCELRTMFRVWCLRFHRLCVILYITSKYWFSRMSLGIARWLADGTLAIRSMPRPR